MIKAVLTSDFHLSVSSGRSAAVVPALEYQPEIMRAFFAHVTEVKPDLLIILGDNTNGGRYADVLKLKEYLLPLARQGIELIMIPGNHDFDCGPEKYYEELLFLLMNPDDRDPFSFSFARRIRDVLFLAMDDHESGRSVCGVLRPETIQWLKKQLDTAAADHLRPVFLSHHSLIVDGWQARKEFYCLQPDTVLPLLQKHGVRLAFCGHQHDAAIYRSGGLYEAAVPMMADGAHQYGLLAITDHTADYSLHRLKFEGSLAEKIAGTDRRAEESKKAVFAKLLENSRYDRDEMMAVLTAFSKAHNNSELYDQRDRIRAMPGFEQTMASLGEGIWRNWIQCLLGEDRLPENRLRIPF